MRVTVEDDDDEDCGNSHPIPAKLWPEPALEPVAGNVVGEPIPLTAYSPEPPSLPFDVSERVNPVPAVIISP